MNRRTVLKSLAVLAAAGSLPIPSVFAEAKKYGFKQSACLWCYNGWMNKNNISLDQFCEAAAKIGIKSLELTGEGQWETMKKYGLCCAMISAPMGITRGFNHTQYHEELIVKTKACVDQAVKWGFPNAITMSGNCEGMGKEEGLANCIKGLKEVVPYAEKNGIVLCMELLNSHGHKDYMCDETKWAVDLVHAIDSPSFKILYDIFHAREMGEDPIKDIREHHDCWGHYHTGGWPGRAEIDLASQELDYGQIMREIAETNYKGWIGQEFVPRRDGLKSLAEAYAICDV